MAAFLTLSLLPLTGIAIFFLHSHSQDLQEQSHSYLISVRDNKKKQVLDYLESKLTEVNGFVRSELAYATGGGFYGFIKAFENLGSNIKEPLINEHNRIENKEADYFANSERYRLLHKRYHQRYTDYLDRSDFRDILLVDIEGNVTYSVLKESNFGVNLLSDIYIKTNLGQTFQRIRTLQGNKKIQNNNASIVISSFSYEQNQQIAWIAAPIIQQGYLHSYGLFSLPVKGIHKLMNDKRASVLLLDANLEPVVIPSKTSIEFDPILTQKNLLLEEVTTDLNNSEQAIISANTPILFKELQWFLSVQIAEREAYKRVEQQEKIFFAVMVMAIVLVVIASLLLAKSITHPLLKLTWVAEKVSAGDLDTIITSTDRTDEIGRLAVSFARMQLSIRDKILTIRQQNSDLEKSLSIIKKQNIELKQADILKDQFLATTSHELRTPLHGMIGIAEALVAGSNGKVSSNQKYQLDIIISSGRRLSTLVDDLLDYHKMRYGNMVISKQSTDLFNTSSLVLQLSMHLLNDKPIRFLNHIPTDLPPVLADPHRLEQVLYNLISNAIKYTQEGKIVLSATQLDNRIQMQIMDTGQGIPEEYLEHIFDPFIQVKEGPFQARHGLGLGLSISQQLVELMGGNLYVSSQLHIGTTFSLTLPLADHLPTEKSNIDNHYTINQEIETFYPELTDLPENRDGPLVLVADDDSVNLRVIESFLRLEGYKIEKALDGCEVLKCIAIEKPDILLLDIMMPGINGFEVCQSIRKTYTTTELPIIMLTALNQAEDIAKGFEVGANDYLNKPFSRQELSARVMAHLSAGKSELRKEKIHILQLEAKKNREAETELLASQKKLIEHPNNTANTANTRRVQNLETAVEILSHYAIEGSSEKLNQLRDLGDEFNQIVDKVSGSGGDKQLAIRKLLVSTMTSAISYWEISTGKSKYDFAEASGIWRVYLDRSTLQTRTLDKYLRLETLPSAPRWRAVLSTVDFILERSKESDYPVERNELKQLAFQLKQLI